MKKIVIPSGLALLVLALGAFLIMENGARDAILLSGNIEATIVDLSFQSPGRVESLYTDEGRKVVRGQLLAELDPAELKDREAGARTQLLSMESRIPQLETAIRLQRQTTDAEISRGEADLLTARSHLEELRNGSRPQEIEQARQAQNSAKSRLDNATMELTRAESLHRTGDLPKKALDSAQMVYEMAQADYKKAAEFLALVVEGPRRESIAAAESRVSQAEALLRQARLGELGVRKLQQQLKTARAEVEHARSQLNLAHTQLQYAQLFSPVSGRVISRNAEIGEVVGVGTPIVSIADLDDIWLRVFIDETDLGKIKLEQDVAVTTDSFPEKVYRGMISFISSEAEFTPKSIQTQKERVKLVYRVKVRIENENQELKPGMPADVVIPLDGVLLETQNR